jgi:glycosyltransferase involved in cell wall biosynthesis
MSRTYDGDEATETVAVVIPTLNEERSIGKVIDSVPVADLLQNGLKTAVYVIDGRSTDTTREIAVEKGATIILEERKGKGLAVQTAFKAITADYTIMVDGDDTYPIEMVMEIIRLLKKYDVVIGSRLNGTIEPGAMSTLNVIGNTLLTLLARALFSINVTDVCTGLWGYRGEAIRRLELEAHGFEIEADMFGECARKGLRFAEIPIRYRARADQAKLSSLRDGLKIGSFLCRKWLMGRISTPAANAQPVSAGALDGPHVALVHRWDVGDRQQKWIHSPELTTSSPTHWNEGDSSDPGTFDEQVNLQTQEMAFVCQ